MMMRQWTALRSPSLRLHHARLTTRAFGSLVADESDQRDEETNPSLEDDKKKKLRIHDVLAAAKAFVDATNHCVVPYPLVIPKHDETVVDGRVVKIGAIPKTPRGVQKNAVIYGRVRDVSEIDWPEATRGMTLGRTIHSIMSSDRVHVESPQEMDALYQLGFPRGKDWARFPWEQQVFAALKTFNKLYDHLFVPQNFVVPRGDPTWPEPAWGLPLGTRVHLIRRQAEKGTLPQWKHDDLVPTGFVFDTSETKWMMEVLPALQTHKQVFGHCLVKKTFVVPREAPWPVDAWGTKLGISVTSIRTQGTYASQVTRDKPLLDAIGFVSDYYEHQWSDRILPSLQAFKRVYGNCSVSFKFIVPSTDQWPEEAWGLNLGTVVSQMRSQGTYQPQVTRDAAVLEALEFVWDVHQEKWDNVILPALETYAQVHGDSRVLKSFIVPSEAPWPQRTWGLNLGSVVDSIRAKGTYAPQVAKDQSLLQAIKFVWDVSEYEWSERILPSLQTYKREFGDCIVPQKFIVPSTDQWPEEAWGLKLGSMVSNIRSRGYYRLQTSRDGAELRAIGFVWDVGQEKWDNVVLPALETFYQVYKHTRVSPTFVVPSEEPWPKRTWGLTLGMTCRRIRRDGAYALQHQRDQEKLDAIEFGKE